MVTVSDTAADAGPITEPPGDNLLVPRHIAIIMDGNGRWAQKRHLPRLFGHRRGVQNMHRIVHACVDLGVPMLTLYAFSTENWARPTDEVEGLMEIFANASERETQDLHANGVRIRHIGSLENVRQSLQEAIRRAVDLTRDNARLDLNVAFNYGGRADVVNAVRRIVAAGVPVESIDEDLISANLYTAGIPDPDLVIRTAGEMRLSNFLIWQAAYSEYYSTPKLWPDFGESDLTEAVDAYAARRRKFGRL